MLTSRMAMALGTFLALGSIAATGCKKTASPEKKGAEPGAESGSATGAAATPPAEPAAGSGSEGKVLKLWHYEAPNSAMGVAWKQAIGNFEKSHPGVTVTFEEKGFEQIQQNAGMILNSDEAPDIMEYNKGNATAGLLSKQGLLTDLTAEATKRGWDKALSASLQTTARYDAKGVMGGDKWFGVP